MPQAEVRRAHVSDAIARQVMQRLRRSGELEVVVNVILDHAEVLDAKLLKALETELLTDGKGLAVFQAVQGAVSELKRTARIIWTLGDALEPAPTRDLRNKSPNGARTAS